MKRYKKNLQIGFLAGLMISIYPAGMIHGEQVTEMEEGENGSFEIVVISDAVVDPQQLTKAPSQSYEYKNQTYTLKSFQQTAVITEEKNQEVKDTIVYQAVEQTDTLPQQASIQVTDEDTGQTETVSMPMIDSRFYDWRWVEGFEFPITVQQYDAERFYLGDRIITIQNQTDGAEQSGNLFAGYEEALLELIGLNPKWYRIEKTEWSSESWLGEDGLVYRQARAAGRKYVADCAVTYGGTALLPSVPAWAWRAVYLREEASAEKPSVEGIRLKASAGEALSTESGLTEREGSWWGNILRRGVRITIGFFFLLLLTALFLSRKKKPKKRL